LTTFPQNSKTLLRLFFAIFVVNSFVGWCNNQ